MGRENDITFTCFSIPNRVNFDYCIVFRLMTNYEINIVY